MNFRCDKVEMSGHAVRRMFERGISTDEVLAVVRADKDLQNGNTKKAIDLVETKVLPHFNFTRMTALALGRELGEDALAKERRREMLDRDPDLASAVSPLPELRQHRQPHRGERLLDPASAQREHVLDHHALFRRDAGFAGAGGSAAGTDSGSPTVPAATGPCGAATSSTLYMMGGIGLGAGRNANAVAIIPIWNSAETPMGIAKERGADRIALTARRSRAQRPARYSSPRPPG